MVISFFPNEGSYSAGGSWGHASSNGIIGLEGSLGSDVALNGAALTLEFYESYDDVTGATDAIYTSGIVTFEYSVVPAPGALALLGLAGMGRRRRS